MAYKAECPYCKKETEVQYEVESGMTLADCDHCEMISELSVIVELMPIDSRLERISKTAGHT